MKISRLVLKLSGHNFHTKLFKEALLHKNVGGVMDLVLCTSSDGVYIYTKYYCLQCSSCTFIMYGHKELTGSSNLSK